MIPIIIKRILTSPWTPIVALLLALGVQTVHLRMVQGDLRASQELVRSKSMELSMSKTLLDERDALIARQNAGIKAITEQRAADREAYVRNFAAASERARDHDDRAAQILAMPVEQLDELAQCRAAKALIQQEIIQ